MPIGFNNRKFDTVAHQTLLGVLQAKTSLTHYKERSRDRKISSWSHGSNWCGSNEMGLLFEKTQRLRLEWSVEHEAITSKYTLPSRAPLPDNGKLVERRGRKATDQTNYLIAGLPKEVFSKGGNVGDGEFGHTIECGVFFMCPEGG